MTDKSLPQKKFLKFYASRTPLRRFRPQLLKKIVGGRKRWSVKFSGLRLHSISVIVSVLCCCDNFEFDPQKIAFSLTRRRLIFAIFSLLYIFSMAISSSFVIDSWVVNARKLFDIQTLKKKSWKFFKSLGKGVDVVRDLATPRAKSYPAELHITVSQFYEDFNLWKELVELKWSSGDVPHHRFTNFTRLPLAKSTCGAQVELKWTSSNALHCSFTNFTRLPLAKCICGAPVKLMKWLRGASVKRKKMFSKNCKNSSQFVVFLYGILAVLCIVH